MALINISMREKESRKEIMHKLFGLENLFKSDLNMNHSKTCEIV